MTHRIKKAKIFFVYFNHICYNTSLKRVFCQSNANKTSLNEYASKEQKQRGNNKQYFNSHEDCEDEVNSHMNQCYYVVQLLSSCSFSIKSHIFTRRWCEMT